MIVIAGISIIVHTAFGSKKNYKTVTHTVSSDDCVNVSFGEETIGWNGNEFEKGNYSVAFGSLTLDLRMAVIAENAQLSVSAKFGELNVLLPDDIDAEIDGNVFLGQIDPPSGGGEKKLKITASATFGQVSIKK